MHSNFKKLDIVNSKIQHLNLEACSIDKLVLHDTEIVKSNRQTFCIIKNMLSKDGNQIDALKYYAREMDEYEYEYKYEFKQKYKNSNLILLLVIIISIFSTALNKVSNKTDINTREKEIDKPLMKWFLQWKIIQNILNIIPLSISFLLTDWLILKFNGITNKHGTSFLRALMCIFTVSVLFYSINANFTNCEWLINIPIMASPILIIFFKVHEKFNFTKLLNIVLYVVYILYFILFAFLYKSKSLDHLFLYMTPFAFIQNISDFSHNLEFRILNVFYSGFMTILYYQAIQALRKFSRQL